MSEQYVETLDGLDIRKFWANGNDEGITVAAKAMRRFDQPAKAIKDIIDNPDIDQHKKEIAVAYISGYTLSIVLSNAPTIEDVLKQLGL